MGYREDVLRTLGKQDRDNDLLHAVMGLCGESGEVIEIVKKSLFNKKKPIDRAHLIEELGDVRWYFELAAIALDTTIIEIEQKNTEKLLTRFPI